MSRILILLTALLVIAGAAQAQVAAPRLNPVSPEAGDAFNPATLSFGGPSRVGIGLSFDLTVEETVSGVTTTTAEGDGKYLVQARYVGEMFSVGVEADKVDLTVPGTNFTGEINTTMANLSILLGETLAIGVGTQSRELVQDLIVTEVAERETLPQVGVTVRLLDGLFIGGSTGDETVEDEGVPIALGGPGTLDGDRTVLRVGVGYFMREEDTGWHLEAYKETKDAIDDQVTGFQVDEEDSTFVAVEVVFSNILIGVERINTDFLDPTTGDVNEEEEASRVSIGYAPMEGLAVMATAGSSETTDPATGNVEQVDTTFVGISWLF